MTRVGGTAATPMAALGAAHVGHAWLAAVLPADAARISVADARLAETLGAAGADVVDGDADVEIASERDLTADAPHVIVPIQPSQLESQPLGRRSSRIAASADVRRRALAVRRRLRRQGYGTVHVVPWDLEHFVRLPGSRPTRRLGGAERFPRRALVVASRGAASETVLQRSVRDAEHAAGVALQPDPPLLRAGTLVTLGRAGVLRLAVGPGERQIDAQERTLAALETQQTPTFVKASTPELLAAGRSGIARWSLEARLPGRPCPHDLPDRVLADCLDFLVALNRLDGSTRTDPVLPLAEVVATAVAPADASRLLGLAEEADRQLAHLPLGFGHGDFCTSNLLVEGDRLSGVVDWDGGGPGRLPLLDLFHLRLLAVTRAAPYEWGSAVVSYLLPLVTEGTDGVVSAYCSALDLRPSRGELWCLALAYWLQRTGYQLGMYVERSTDRLWIQRNVDDVLRRFAAGPPKVAA